MINRFILLLAPFVLTLGLLAEVADAKVIQIDPSAAEIGRNRGVAVGIAGDVDAVGSALLASHVSVRDDYEVSCAELDNLVETAAAETACAGARMMGGGFGGCTLNLVRQDEIDDFAAHVGDACGGRFAEPPAAVKPPVAVIIRLVAGAQVHLKPGKSQR